MAKTKTKKEIVKVGKRYFQLLLPLEFRELLKTIGRQQRQSMSAAAQDAIEIYAKQLNLEKVDEQPIQARTA